MEFALDSELLRNLLDVSGAPTAVFDLDGYIVFANEAMLAATGYTREQLIGSEFVLLMHPDDVEEERQAAVALIKSSQTGYQAQRRYRHADGHTISMVIAIAVLTDGAGRVTHFLLHAHDITPLRQAEEHARRAEAVLRTAFENAPIGMGLVALDGTWLQVNDALARMLGYTADELLAKSVMELTDERDRDADDAAIHDLAEGRRRTYAVEKRYRHADGHLVWVRLHSAVVLDDDGAPSYFVSQYEDVSDRKLADQRLAHLALHDPLTGLANRTLLLDRMEVALAQRSREGGRVVVAFGDLDDFKSVNDEFGHAAGDELLTEVARRLQGAVRAGDTVARLGGDEFVVVTTLHDEEVTAFANRLREAVEPPPGRHGRMSIGVAVCPPDAVTPRGLLMVADEAMYAQKKARRGIGPRAPYGRTGPSEVPVL